jgi:hypothetical protein
MLEAQAAPAPAPAVSFAPQPAMVPVVQQMVPVAQQMVPVAQQMVPVAQQMVPGMVPAAPQGALPAVPAPVADPDVKVLTITST